eukprot:6211019-Pleurochrysis_carterae.AAC.7
MSVSERTDVVCSGISGQFYQQTNRISCMPISGPHRGGVNGARTADTQSDWRLGCVCPQICSVSVLSARRLCRANIGETSSA